MTRYVRLRMRDPNQIEVRYQRRARLPAVKMVLSSARRAAWLFLRDPAELTNEEKLFTGELMELSAGIKQVVTLTKQFQELVNTRNIDLLEQWWSAAENLSSKWKNFVKGLGQDGAAVKAALTTDWSNGHTEGQVNRLKFLKRQMFGRAKFDLLRARVLYRG